MRIRICVIYCIEKRTIFFIALAYTHVKNVSYYLQKGDNMEEKSLYVKDACAIRLRELCLVRNIRLNTLATLSGVTPSTVYSLMDERRRDVSVITIKKMCDGLGITLKEFFDDQIFDELEQEIR